MKNNNEKINEFLENKRINKEKFDDLKNIAKYTDFNIKIMRWFRDIHDFELVGWRNKNVTKSICDIMLTQEDIQLYALFCPSYKKGIDEFGFRVDDVGATTKNGLNKLKELYEITKKNNFKVKKPKAIFFDLALEQPEKTILMLDDLEKNILNFKKYVPEEIEFVKLSDMFPELKDIIGYSGIITEPLLIQEDLLRRIIERGRKFYELFGWDEGKILERSKIIASSEAIVGSIIRRNMPNSIMLYTPTMLERAQVYSGMQQKNPLAIIVPKK